MFSILPVGEFDWVLNSFANQISYIGLIELKQLLKLQSSHSLKLKFNELTLIHFWNIIITH